MTTTVGSDEREELLRKTEKMTQLVTLIQEYPAEAQLIMAAIEEGLTLGPAHILDAARHREESGAVSS